MTDQARCPRCHSELGIRLAGALCPACLLRAAMDTPDEAEDADAEPPFQTITLLSDSPSGPIFLAQPIGTTRRVALKIARNAAPGITKRFDRWRGPLVFERYAGIARVVDAGPATDGCVYIADEFATGASLPALLRQQRLDLTARRAVFDQVLAAVAALHLKGIAHMRLSVDRIRVVQGDQLQATVVGAGRALLLANVDPNPAQDFEALEHLASEWGVSR